MTIENWTNNVEFNDDFLRSSTMDMSQAEEIHISYKWAYAHKERARTTRPTTGCTSA